jgi:hypothetical protein
MWIYLTDKEIKAAAKQRNKALTAKHTQTDKYLASFGAAIILWMITHTLLESMFGDVWYFNVFSGMCICTLFVGTSFYNPDFKRDQKTRQKFDAAVRKVYKQREIA